MAHSADERLSQLKAACFRGVAKVRLNALNFQHPLIQQEYGKLSSKKVRWLRSIFETVGCLRLQEEHFIDAVVDDTSLDNAIAASQVSRGELLSLREGQEIPLLNLRCVECLSGLHRIEAAKAFLDDNDQWWIVRLFTKSAPQSILAKIVAAEQRPPSDGEVFRRILLCRRRQEQVSENQWWAYLDHSKPKDLRQLLKNPPLAAAFESLADIPGLWAKLQLGTLHRLLALKCDEEMICYLEHVKKTWDLIITCGDTVLPYTIVDDSTTDYLEALCPKVSASDRETVVTLMKDRIIFPSVDEERHRQALQVNIMNISCLIPSLLTFFENLKFLEPPSEILRRLIGRRIKSTIRKSLFGYFFMPEKIIVQSSATHHMEYRTQLDQLQAAEVAYIQLWAFCSRHFDELSNHGPKKENGKDKPMIVEQNPVMWQCLATFAAELGFSIPDAPRLAMEDSRTRLALDYLRKANPHSLNFNNAQIRRVVLAGILPDDPAEEVPVPKAVEVKKERRFGRPSESELQEDKHHLFIPTMYRDQEYPTVTLRFVRNDLFRCIFDSFRLHGEDLGPPVLSDPERASPAIINETIVNTGSSINDSSKKHANKRRRLEYDVRRLNGEIQRLTTGASALVNELSTLREISEPRNSFSSPGRQIVVIDDDAELDHHVLAGTQQHQTVSFLQQERLEEEMVEQQLQIEQQEADDWLIKRLEQEQAERYWGVVLE